jgi:hypothetical protein
MRQRFLLAGFLIACGGTGNGFDSGIGDDGGGNDGTTNDTGIIFEDTGIPESGPPADVTQPPVDYVYSHSPTVLYKVDPVAKTMTTIGNFSSNCGNENVIDIAIDQNNNGYATTFAGVYKLDLTNAKCTLIAQGSYPNSLSFVPAGTLDPNVEALVGYNGSTYVRINTTTGAVTNVGGLTGGYSSSGDIVSVKNGGTFLTVTGNSCGDCLLQVDPKTGNMKQNYGSINHGAVFGIAFWAGVVYGFDDAGELFSITWQNNQITTTNIPTTSGLEFWGAGSTTSAPATGDGGIPIN